MLIKYLDKEMNTEFFANEITDEFCDQMREEFYKKPSFDEVKKNLKKIAQGGSKVTEIEKYYFKDLMAKCKKYTDKWSIEEFLQSNDLIRHAFGRINKSPKVYTNEQPIKNLETYFRIGSKRATGKVSNFPIKSAEEMITEYNINGNYYDYSCGWGIRLLCSLRNNINYYGTDPNNLLTERLSQLEKDYRDVNNTTSNVDIRTQGSEVFVPEWVNTMGMAFSSPPYFNLEDYRVGEQSYKEGMTLVNWLENYITPTVNNIYEYLIDGGYFLINIKDYQDNGTYKIVKPILDIIKYRGFTLVGGHTLKVTKRVRADKKENTFSDETIYVFKKVVDK